MNEATTQRPLTDVRVLDLSRGMPGALATMLLADYGAEVISVEPPAGGMLRRSGGHSVWNRGKRSVVMDLDDPASAARAQELARGADIVVEDHRPGKLASWGLGSQQVSLDNPDVIYCSISGYGQAGDDNDRVQTDAAVAARLGVMNEWAGAREGPIFLGHPAIAYATGLLSAIAILACLRSRFVSGQGDHLDISLVDGTLALYAMNWWNERGGDSIEAKDASGELRFGHKRLLLRTFACRDGRLIQVHTGAAGAFDRAMQVFGLAERVSKTAGDVQMASLLTDRDLEILGDELPNIMKTKTVDEWLGLLWEAQVAALPIGEPGEALDDDQIRHAGIVCELDDPELGDIEVVGPPVLMSDSPGGIAWPAPTLDQHGDAIRDTGWIAPGLPRVAEPRRLERPLDGIRVVELATFFAAPYGHRLLSDLGADVVKVEHTEGDPMRPLVEFFEGANRGKRGVAANLKDPRALEFVHRLTSSADVVHHNLRPGVAERLGVDFATLSVGRDDLVYHYSPGYGSTGPKAGLQSFAPLLSGYVGVFAVGAGEGNRPHATFGNEDYYNGLLGACACLLGLIHRERTGRGQFVESPQLHSSLLTISEYYKRDGGYHTTIPRLGKDLYGWTVGYRLYQALDAWVCVTCVHGSEVETLAHTVLPAGALADLDDSELRVDAPATGPLAEQLQYHFVSRTAADWVAALREVGVPIEAVRDDSWLAHDAFHDEGLLAEGRIMPMDHPVHGPAHIVGHMIRPSHHGTATRGRAPVLGEHTAAVLAELGYSHADIDQLAADGAVRLAGSVERASA